MNTTNQRALRTYLADCASLALSLTDQQSQAPAFAVRIMCNHNEQEHLAGVRLHVDDALHAARQACTDRPELQSLLFRVYAWRLCAWCLCDDASLPLNARLANQIVQVLLSQH